MRAEMTPPPHSEKAVTVGVTSILSINYGQTMVTTLGNGSIVKIPWKSRTYLYGWLPL